ncbi:MAG: type II secretion system protein [Candidatus Paceibacterota bacterium]|jgi:prepilin-type N-terminal cleavage/methylation domain-containing protein
MISQTKNTCTRFSLVRIKGFTLIELLVVIAIIGLLSSVVLASLSSARAKARDNTRIQNLVQLRTALELYASSNNGNYPSTGSIHNVFMDPGCTQTHPLGGDFTGTQTNWIPGLVPSYISILPKDPTSKSFDNHNGCYMYSSDGTGYILSAYGTVEGNSNGGTMDSNFGYREMWLNDNLPTNDQDQYCYYSTNYPAIDAVKRKSFTITNLTTSDMHGCATIP